jgi:hypothetical protein
MMFSFNTCRFVICALALSVVAAEPVVDLGTAGDYAVLAKTGISTVPSSAITGDIAVSPIAASAITGFSLAMDSTNEFSTSTQVTGTGKVYAANYHTPTPATLTSAVLDMQTAYTDAAGRAPGVGPRLNLGGGILGGVNPGGPNAKLTAGVYTFSTEVSITGDLHFTGSNTDVFIIQVSLAVKQAANYKIVLEDGAKAENIFWQVATEFIVGAGAHVEGIILAKTAVTFGTGSSLNGRILTQTACTLQSATITEKP